MTPARHLRLAHINICICHDRPSLIFGVISAARVIVAVVANAAHLATAHSRGCSQLAQEPTARMRTPLKTAPYAECRRPAGPHAPASFGNGPAVCAQRTHFVFMYTRDHPLCALRVLTAACVRIAFMTAMARRSPSLELSAQLKRSLVEWPHADTWTSHGAPSEFACDMLYKALKRTSTGQWPHRNVVEFIHAVAAHLFSAARAAKRGREFRHARRITRKWMPRALWHAICVPAESASGSPLDHLVGTSPPMRTRIRRPVGIEESFMRRVTTAVWSHDSLLSARTGRDRPIFYTRRAHTARVEALMTYEATCVFVPDEASFVCSGKFFSV